MKKVKAEIIWYNKNKGYGEISLEDGSTALITKEEFKEPLKSVIIKKPKEDIGVLKNGEQFVYQSFSK